MKENHILLSILVPTFNRLHLLKMAIKRMQSMGYFTNNRIEVLVADNCSTDGTRDFLVAENINHFSQIENLGYARNLISLLQKANGKYTWVIGDDDLTLLTADELVELIVRNNGCEFYVFGEELNIANLQNFNQGILCGVLSMPFGFISNVIQKKSDEFLELCKSHIGLHSHDSPHFFARWCLWARNRSNVIYYDQVLVESVPVNTSRFLNYKNLFSIGEYDRSFNWYSAYMSSLQLSELSSFLPNVIKTIIFNNLKKSYEEKPCRFIFYWVLRLYHGIFIRREYSIFMIYVIAKVITAKNNHITTSPGQFL